MFNVDQTYTKKQIYQILAVPDERRNGIGIPVTGNTRAIFTFLQISASLAGQGMTIPIIGTATCYTGKQKLAPIQQCRPSAAC